MAEQNLAEGLTALAEHAGRTGRLAVAADIRMRGDRRRRWRYAGSTGLGLLVAGTVGTGIALGQSSSGNEPPVAPPVPAASVRSPAVSLSPASLSPAMSSSPGDSIPPGVPRSPIKAPPPEYTPPPGGTTPATTYRTPPSTASPGVHPPTLP